MTLQLIPGDHESARVDHVAVDRHGRRTVRVLCPFCDEHHRHGWPPDDEATGHRTAHCGAGDYAIEFPPLADPIMRTATIRTHAAAIRRQDPVAAGYLRDYADTLDALAVLDADR